MKKSVGSVMGVWIHEDRWGSGCERPPGCDAVELKVETEGRRGVRGNPGGVGVRM